MRANIYFYQFQNWGAH